jgi:hypothetical protein
MPSAQSAPVKPRTAKPDAPRPEPRILFQKYFKSVGPRTYAIQVKEASNGNHFLVLTEGKRDDKTGEVRKTRLFVFSEDFQQFISTFDQAVKFIRDNPISPEVAQRRRKFWEKQGNEGNKVTR